MKNTLILIILIAGLFKMAHIQNTEHVSEVVAVINNKPVFAAMRKPASSEQPIRHQQHLPTRNQNAQKNLYNNEYNSAYEASEESTEEPREITTQEDIQNEYEAQANYQENSIPAGQEDPNFSPETSYDYDRNVAQDNVAPEYFPENGTIGNLDYQQPTYEAPTNE